MFDITEHAIQHSPADASCRLIRRGTIVSCFFPLVEAPDKPGPAARPALVTGVFRDRTSGQGMAVVAYGTTRTTRANRGFEVRISHAESQRLAGLHEPTRFTLTRLRILPVGPEFFAFKQGAGPVLGNLDENLRAHLDATCGRIVGLVEGLRPFLMAVDTRIGSLPAPDSQVLRSEPCDHFLQTYFIGRSDLARRLAKGAIRPAASRGC